jgi:Protein of unknown function (DUF3551)
MRSVIIAATILMLASFADAAHAEWCAVYRVGGTNCGFQTFQQCMATVAGIGGFCNGSSSPSVRQSTRPQRTSTRTSNIIRQTRREHVRQTSAKPARQIASRQHSSHQTSSTRGAKFSPGDDDHVIPANPE